MWCRKKTRRAKLLTYLVTGIALVGTASLSFIWLRQPEQDDDRGGGVGELSGWRSKLKEMVRLDLGGPKNARNGTCDARCARADFWQLRVPASGSSTLTSILGTVKRARQRGESGVSSLLTAPRSCETCVFEPESCGPRQDQGGGGEGPSR